MPHEESLGEFIKRQVGEGRSVADVLQSVRPPVENVLRGPTERMLEADQQHERAAEVIKEYDLEDLHRKQEVKLGDLHAIREQQAEHARHLRQLDLDLDVTELDALAEMEADPNQVPGKNAEIRKLQRERWLIAHHGYRDAWKLVRAAEVTRDGLEIEYKRVEGELASLKTLIQIRTAEMHLIASFVGR